MENKPQVLIIMGSESDYEVMKESARVLEEFKVAFEITVASAHRSPERSTQLAQEAKARGIQVIIAGAGHAAHLAGVLAADTTLPVLGVPIDSSPLDGLDSLLATAQMPGGVPVATLGIGKSGAKNAGMLAVRILSLANSELSEKHEKACARLAEGVGEAAQRVKKLASDEFPSSSE